jgi:hypothetical protein
MRYDQVLFAFARADAFQLWNGGELHINPAALRVRIARYRTLAMGTFNVSYADALLSAIADVEARRASDLGVSD